MRSAILAATVILVGGAVMPAVAETMQFKATLSPTTEVPPHPDLKGTGKVEATFDTSSMKLTYTASFDGLTGKPLMAHFHGPAPMGKNAGVMVPVTGVLASPIEGSATLTADQAKALEDGQMYFNVHTEANKGGEIRGQLEKSM